MKIRLTVYRAWGQISVKDFDWNVTHLDIENYVNNTWKDVKGFETKLVRYFK